MQSTACIDVIHKCKFICLYWDTYIYINISIYISYTTWINTIIYMHHIEIKLGKECYLLVTLCVYNMTMNIFSAHFQCDKPRYILNYSISIRFSEQIGKDLKKLSMTWLQDMLLLAICSMGLKHIYLLTILNKSHSNVGKYFQQSHRFIMENIVF